MRPFRWDVRRREQLGRLLSGETPETYPGFVPDLRRCAARVVAAAGDARLVFVGRSPESLFDYLSGVFSRNPWKDRLALVNLSLRTGVGVGDADSVKARTALREHLASFAITPQRVSSGDRPLALVDLVDTGSTFKGTVAQLASWARQEGIDVAAVRRRLRIVGVTWRTKTSPKTFRRHQHADRLRVFPRIKVRNVSAPDTGDFLGNRQPKVSASHPPWRWADETYAFPPRHESHTAALRLAVHIYTLGATKAERVAFSSELPKTTAMREPWCRTLVAELRSAQR